MKGLAKSWGLTASKDLGTLVLQPQGTDCYHRELICKVRPREVHSLVLSHTAPEEKSWVSPGCPDRPLGITIAQNELQMNMEADLPRLPDKGQAQPTP